MSDARSIRQPRIRPLPLSGVLRVNRPSDIWFKPATSVAVAFALVLLPLLITGRGELAVYVMPGAFCALYGHQLPYAARIRTIAWVVVGMTMGMAVALVGASLVGSVVALIAIAAVVAGIQKAVCDATRIGPPGHVIFVFVVSGTLFAPQELRDVPFHLGLTIAAGLVGAAVALAPALIRRDGPERRATARALDAAADYLDTSAGPPNTAPGYPDTSAGPPNTAPGYLDTSAGVADTATGYLDATGDAARHRTRHAAAAAVQGAWQSLLAGGKPTPTRRTLAHLVLRAEAALGTAPGTTDSGPLRTWAHQVRGHGPLPAVLPANSDGPLPAVALPTGGDELLGVLAEQDGRRALGPGRVLSLLLRPGSPLQPVAVRCAVGCALAGYAGLALGVGHPYWAVVSAAAIYQANVTLTWHRVLQRLVGNLCGVALFAAVVPLARVSVVALAMLCVFFSFCTEALITRNYWLGSVTVTPMALLITEFATARQPVAELISDRVLDTLAGVTVGMVVAVLITNRRTGGRMEQALDATEHATAFAERVLTANAPSPAEHTPPTNQDSPTGHTSPINQDSPTRHTSPTNQDSPTRHTSPTNQDSPTRHTSPTNQDSPTRHTSPTNQDSPTRHTSPTNQGSPAWHTSPTNRGSSAERAPATGANFPTEHASAADADVPTERAKAADAAFFTELAVARRRLTAALVELRDAADTAAGEWWQRALPEERLLRAEQRGHRTLAATVRRQEPVHGGLLLEEQQA